eukprot:6183841-Pleurochrysis_carterae.AAC.2
MLYSKVPVRNRGRSRDEGGASELHNGAKGALGHTVELVHVRWASRTLHPDFCEEVGKPRGKEFSRMIEVQCPHETARFLRPLTQPVRDAFRIMLRDNSPCNVIWHRVVRCPTTRVILLDYY